MGRGPPGPRSRPRLVCGGRTRPVEQRDRLTAGVDAPNPASRCSPIPTGAARSWRPAWPTEAHCAPSPSEAKLNSDAGYFCNSAHPLRKGGRWRADGNEEGQMSILTPGNTGTDVFPPRFTVRPSLRISRFRPRAPGSPPAGRGKVRLARKARKGGAEAAGGQRERLRARGKEGREEGGAEGRTPCRSGWVGRESGIQGRCRSPWRPYGRKARRSVSTDSSASSRKSSSRTTPSPPRKRPRPPDPCLSSKRRRMTGYLRGPGGSERSTRARAPAPRPGRARTTHLLSRISGSVMRVLVMWLCTPLRPCQPGPAPAPPATVS